MGFTAVHGLSGLPNISVGPLLILQVSGQSRLQLALIFGAFVLLYTQFRFSCLSSCLPLFEHTWTIVSTLWTHRCCCPHRWPPFRCVCAIVHTFCWSKGPFRCVRAANTLLASGLIQTLLDAIYSDPSSCHPLVFDTFAPVLSQINFTLSFIAISNIPSTCAVVQT